MKTIKELHYNYRQAVSDGKEIFAEDYDIAEVGKNDVVTISEHLPMVEGDKYYCDIEYKDGSVYRTFNMCGIKYQQ